MNERNSGHDPEIVRQATVRILEKLKEGYLLYRDQKIDPLTFGAGFIDSLRSLYTLGALHQEPILRVVRQLGGLGQEQPGIYAPFLQELRALYLKKKQGIESADVGARRMFDLASIIGIDKAAGVTGESVKQLREYFESVGALEERPDSSLYHDSGSSLGSSDIGGGQSTSSIGGVLSAPDSAIAEVVGDAAYYLSETSSTRDLFDRLEPEARDQALREIARSGTPESKGEFLDEVREEYDRRGLVSPIWAHPLEEESSRDGENFLEELGEVGKEADEAAGPERAPNYSLEYNNDDPHPDDRPDGIPNYSLSYDDKSRDRDDATPDHSWTYDKDDKSDSTPDFSLSYPDRNNDKDDDDDDGDGDSGGDDD